MIQIEFNPWVDVEVKQYQEELRQEVARRILVDQLRKAGTEKTPLTTSILGLLGKELSKYGNLLQERYGSQMDREGPSTQPNETQDKP